MRRLARQAIAQDRLLTIIEDLARVSNFAQLINPVINPAIKGIPSRAGEIVPQHRFISLVHPLRQFLAAARVGVGGLHGLLVGAFE